MNIYTQSSDYWFNSLLTADHLWFFEGFAKSTVSAFFDKKVVTILRRYLLRERFELIIDDQQRRFMRTHDGQIVYVSISHSDHYLLLGVSRFGPLGVDIETIAKPRRYQAIVQRYHFKEPINSHADFLYAWTAREAFLKLLGCGIAGHLSSVVINSDEKGVVVGFDGLFRHRVNYVVGEHTIAAVCQHIAAPSLTCFSANGSSSLNISI